MGIRKNYVQKIHQSSKRDPIQRMMDDKATCMQIARKYDFDYWDGKRRYGYGGYKYIPNYWVPVAKKIINDYNLSNDSKILDVGCGKGYLLYEIKQLIPNIIISGFDSSEYALSNAKEEIKPYIFNHRAEDKTKYKDDEFDLVFSLATLHNLHLKELVSSLKEITRIGKKSYVMVESYRDEQELFNLQCWALTCNAFYNDDDWQYIFDISKFSGDYEFIYFE